MLQTVSNSGHQSWPGSIANAVASKTEGWSQRIRRRDSNLPSPLHGDVTRLYPEAVVASSDSLAWHHIRLIHLRHGLDEMTVPPSDSHCLLLNLSAPLHINARYNKSSFEGQVGASEVAIIPAGTTWTCQAHSSHLSNTLLVYLRPLFVRGAAKEFDFSTEASSLTPQIGFHSKHIRHVTLSLLGELNEGSVVGRFYADSLAIGLAMQLIRRYSSLRDLQIGHGGMAPHRLRKALGLIDQHLEEEEEGRVGLRAIAKQVGMSYFHFSRAFKQSVGMTPTNYIAERRIEHAKKLMQETDLPIAEISLRAGFSSQSHFTTSFRRLTGITPRSFRRGI